MKLYFKINKKEYSTVDSDKLTLTQYINILNIIQNNDNDLDLSKELLLELTNIPANIISELNEYSILIIDWEFYIKSFAKINKIKENYDNYKVKNLDNLTFGNYIDLDYYVVRLDEDYRNIIPVIALMLLPQEYSKKDFEIAQEYVKKQKVRDIIEVFNYFISYRSNIFNSFKFLFGEEEEYDDSYTEEEIKEIEEEKKEKAKQNSWLDTAYFLTNKDITKVDEILNKNFLSVLNYLSWLKEQNQKEMKILKK